MIAMNHSTIPTDRNTPSACHRAATRSHHLKQAALIACGVAALTAAAPMHAATYSAVNDFSLNGNPNGVWSYGSLSAVTGGTFSLYTDTGTNQNFTGSQNWYNGQGFPNTASVLRNTTTTMQTNGGSVVYFPNELEIDGESLTTDVRWTSPATGLYNVSGLFERTDTTSSAAVTVSIIENGTTTLFSAPNFQTYLSQQTFNFGALSLPAGTTLDFVESAAQANNDSTGLAATISTVPEPSSLVGVACTVAAGLWRTRKRSASGQRSAQMVPSL